MIRLSDYVAHRLAEHGIRHVFLVTGGGAMHLNDALGWEKRLSLVCCHHEQTCAMAAESYYRRTGQLAAVNVTTGPGGTNAITGVYGAYVDSLGMIVISGQVKFETCLASTSLPLRQLGDQEVDIVSIVKPITKYAVLVTDPNSIRYHLERALHLAENGRPGPVWLDIPINVQAAMIDPATLQGYDPAEDAIRFETNLSEAVTTALERLRSSERPAILCGAGVRISRCHNAFLEVANKLGIPVTSGWNAHDVIWNSHPLYVGRPSSVGDRAGNFAVQNSDFLLVLGSRLNIRQISYSWKNFARAAYKVMVDIDPAELAKPTLTVDLPIHADLGDFFREVLASDYPGPTKAHKEYLAWCLTRKEKYPVVLPEYHCTTDVVNPYVFVEALYRELADDACVVTGDGTACVATFQAADLKPGHRLYTNSGSAPMGYDLPAAIGACFAGGKDNVICIAGDGSIQMNLQELQTIVTHQLPIKIFVLNNQGYASIRQTQQNFFPDNPVGCGVESGLGFPDCGRIAGAYGIGFRRASDHKELSKAIRSTLDSAGPQICEVMLDIQQPFAPKLSSKRLPDGTMVSAPLEDLAPFLPREELMSNMLIPPLREGV